MFAYLILAHQLLLAGWIEAVSPFCNSDYTSQFFTVSASLDCAFAV